jgi:hypothetical protein
MPDFMSTTDSTLSVKRVPILPFMPPKITPIESHQIFNLFLNHVCIIQSVGMNATTKLFIFKIVYKSIRLIWLGVKVFSN